MNNPDGSARTLALLALLLDYPTTALAAAADECAELLGSADAAAAARVAEFGSWVAERSLGEVEEAYVNVFELDSQFQPYIGYHLFGETYKRSLFLCGLEEQYAKHSYTHRGELGDHLAVMLRFAAACNEREVVDELMRDALLPAVEKMVRLEGRVQSEGCPEETANVTDGSLLDRPGGAAYRGLLDALGRLLKASIVAPAAPVVAGEPYAIA